MNRPAGTDARRTAAEQRGRRAESLAVLWLRLHGWTILDRRRRLPMIELDIVARRGRVLAVVEVKWRATVEQAIFALQPPAIARLQRAAHQLVASENARGAGLDARVDLIALAPGRLPRHIANIDAGPDLGRR